MADGVNGTNNGDRWWPCCGDTAGSGGLTLAEAQQLFDAAPDLPLPPGFAIRGLRRCCIADLSGSRRRHACHLLGDLGLLHADVPALGRRRWAEPPA